MLLCDKKLEVIKMRVIYSKPEVKDLSQGSRIAFIRQFRYMTQDKCLSAGEQIAFIEQ